MNANALTRISFCALAVQHAFVNALELGPRTFAQKTFDFVVVGGGSAGLALATRLSDNPALTVGVIEAGTERDDDKILIPGFYGSTLGDPLYDWNFVTAPQERLNGRRLPFHRGKVLGGTSAINGMVHSRAAKPEYDGWESLGNPGWNWNTMQSNIKKSENWTAPDKLVEAKFHANNDPRNHGTRGAVHSAAYTFYPDIVLPYFKAVQRQGIHLNMAMSSGDSSGIWTLNGAIDAKNVSRSYSANAYYKPNAGRKNLSLLTGAQVTKIITKTLNGMVVATGVQYFANNQTFAVKVGKEVILSAGTIQTPQILELSGIGNKTLLESVSIPVKVDLPGVGENLHDHFGVVMTFQTLSNFTGQDQLLDPNFAAQQLQQYLTNRTGMYSSTATTLAFLSMNDLMPASTARRLKIDLDKALKTREFQSSHLRKQFDLQRKWLDDPKVPQVEIVLFASLFSGVPQPGKRYYSIAVFLQHLWSRGSVHTTDDPLAAPEIDGSYLKAPGDFDMKLLVESLKWVRKVTQTEPLKSATLASLNPPADATDEQLSQFIIEEGTTEWHFAGTAAMLPRSQQGVVDAHLKVHGTTNIRVVDASVLPVHVATHPTVTLYGMAERAAEALRNGEWH
ncbi:Pyranose dehydrogenase 3 [Hypsizygus marmoreus]|uniref:Pyranose dehydrogenase 3 n=1 Tax=Hypsizygus marmoreus TaxID=39966 RepID=A0A369JBE4_HYPMA|nr:Pyranose dehydrogenase 3 [Hypsizygus marmoreus]